MKSFLLAAGLVVGVSPLWGQVFQGYLSPGVVASSRPVAQAGGGGGGGPALTLSYKGGKFSTGGATTLVITPAVKPSTNSLISVGAFAGQSTFTSCVDNRGNAYIQDNFDNRANGGTSANAIWHFVATATYLGAYTITVTVPVSAPMVASVMICSNTQTTASVDVGTSAFRTSAVVEVGTSAVTNANNAAWIHVFNDNSGVNDAITPRGPNMIEMAEEQDGSSFLAGAIALSTTTTAGVTTSGNWSLAASKQWNSITVGYKTP